MSEATKPTLVPMWEDAGVVCYQCRAKNHAFMQGFQAGKGLPAGETVVSVVGQIGELNGKYVAFPLKNGGCVVRARKAKA